MPLSTGTRLGPYEIRAPIGAGGMGEVYRATDTRLRREVALKVLPTAFVRDSDRMARFSREAQMLAALLAPTSYVPRSYFTTRTATRLSPSFVLDARTRACPHSLP